MIFQYRGCLLIGQNVQLSISKKNFGMNRMIEVRLKYAKMLRNVVFVETKQKMKEQSFGGILLSESICLLELQIQIAIISMFVPRLV